jgi:hypothetical protein
MDYVIYVWKHHIWINERIISSGKNPQQIIVLPIKVVKRLQKTCTIWLVKHAFVWGIIYRQGSANVSVTIRRKENIKIFMGNWLIRFI